VRPPSLTDGSRSTSGPTLIDKRKITIQKFKEAAPSIRYSKSKSNAKMMAGEDFGKEWAQFNVDGNADGISEVELLAMWEEAQKVRGKVRGGGWLSGRASAASAAKVAEVVSKADVDGDGVIGLVEWVVQHAFVNALVLMPML
jgi:hypothetical protein